MQRFRAFLLVVGLAAVSRAQDLTAAPGAAEGLDAIRAQTEALKNSPPRAPLPRREDAHRIGHSTPPAQTAEAPDVSAYPVRGVDVSHFEGSIDWPRARASGTLFAFMKATEGTTFVDDAFAANWSSSAAAGVLRGAYHFYDFCATGSAQADNFIRTVPRDARALPLVVDLEVSDDCAKMPAKAAFLKDLSAFVGKVRAAYGRTPILYINLDIYNQYLVGVAPNYRLWIADPSHSSPLMPAGRKWAFWQYSWHGNVPGIAIETDLDVFVGDPAELVELARP
jgi:lysozyme